MKTKSLMRKMMTRLAICIAVLFALAAPAFYFLTKNYYAEDMADLIEAVEAGKKMPVTDLTEDVAKGIMLQYALIAVLLCAAVLLTVRLLSGRLWRPFDKTLESISRFRLENAQVPDLPHSNVTEFEKLNQALRELMEKNAERYVAQKEFTENASHEMQTPLAIFQTKLDLLLQLPGLTAQQAEIIQDLFQMTARLSRMNRNLLLLAKIDNKQFDADESVLLSEFIDSVLPSLEGIAGGLRIVKQYSHEPLCIRANRILLESMVRNLFVNAVRHNVPNGTIAIVIADDSLTVSNTSGEPALSPKLVFKRFYRPARNADGNGLGLAIVKAICDYHGWSVEYGYRDNRHSFQIRFS